MSSSEEWCCFIGFVFVAYCCIRLSLLVLLSLYEHFAGIVFLKQRLRKYGKWAVITGCSRGLGTEFVRQLAELGFNIVLIGRSKTVLDQIASDTEKDFDVKTTTIEVDLCHSFDVYGAILPQLKGKDVGLLINNAGVMYDRPEMIYNLPPAKLEEMISVNVSAMTMITYAIVKEFMLPKKSGLVISLSSGGSYHPTPQLSVYAATKKYVDYLCRCLDGELGSSGIHIQSLVPFYIATDMTKYSSLINQAGFWSPAANTYVRQALWTAGMTSVSTGYFPHTIQMWMSSLIPERLWMISSYLLMKILLNSPVKAGEVKQGKSDKKSP